MSPTPRRALLSLIAACLLSGTAAAQTPPAPDAADRDPNAPACTDFYQHANGGWLARTALPAGDGRWSRFDEINRRALEQQRALLEAAAATPKDDLDRLLGAFWASGLDEAAIDAAGAAPLAPVLARIDRIKRLRDVGGAIGELHAQGLPVLFRFGADLDLRDFDRQIAYATQGGLGLPDRDYYLREDADTRALLGRYRAHIERLLALVGTPAAEIETQSGWIVGIEMRLASASLGLVELRDPWSAYKPTSVKELSRRYPNLRLDDFLRAQDLRRLDSLSLAHERFFAAVDSLLAEKNATAPVEHWRAYLRFHVANALAPYLSAGFREAQYALYGQLLGGRPAPAPRWQQALASVDLALGDVLGRRYVEAHLSDPARAQAEAVVLGVRDALGRAIAASAWMSDAAKSAAKAKLDALRVEVGQPAQWADYAGLELDRRAYAANVLAAAKWRHARDLAQIGKAAPRRWRVPTQTPDLAYDLALNRLTVSAALLQPPVFAADAGAAANHGALGMLAGQQLTHGFDALGRTIDASRQLRDWWTPADAEAFAQRTAPLIAQYDAYHALPGIPVNGRQTQGENIADLGGVELAWAAYRRADAKADAEAARRFFYSLARLWQRKLDEESLKLELATGVHAPARFRVNGPLSNLPAFAETFDCKPDQPMRRADPVALWR